MATNALYPNASSAVWPGGQIMFAVTFESAIGSNLGVVTTGVTIGITASDAVDSGVGVPLPVTSSGVVNQNIGQYRYTWNCPIATVPGSYTVTWTGQRQSDNVTVTYVQGVMVVAGPVAAPDPGVYATVTQYRNQTQDQFTPDPTVAMYLAYASRDIDRALIGAVYLVDADGLPTEPGLINTLRTATCHQTQYLVAQNDPTGIKYEYSSTNIGGVAVTRTARMQGRHMPALAPRALQELQLSGILQTAVLVNW